MQTFRPACRLAEGKDSRWDIRDQQDPRYTLEVKHDRRVHTEDDTGNYAFELSYRKNPSGISVSRSKFWVQSDCEGFTFFLTVPLRFWLSDHRAECRMVNGGDNHWSELQLVKRERLSSLEICRIKKDEQGCHIPLVLL